MLKTLRTFAMAALAMVSMNALADTTVTWTASEQGYTNAEKLTDVEINLDNVVTAVFAKGTGSTEPAYYDAGTAARLYGGNTLTIATKDESNITAISLAYTVNKLTDDKLSASAGTLTAADGTATWSGSETSVQFSNTNSSGHFRIATITVTYAGGTGVTKTSTTVTIDATGLTNTDLANGTAAGKLVATVAAGDNTLSDAVVAWTSDNEQVATIAEDGTVTLVAAGEAKLKAEYAGDDNYYGSSATYTLTVKNSAYQTVGQGTLENPFTASDAIWLANNGEYADEECYIKGIVFKVNTTDANITSYGNIDYFISEDGQEKTPSFEVFRGYYFDGAKFTVDTKVLVGDEVVVKGMLKMYNDQAETAQGAVLVKLVRDGQEVTPVESIDAPVISGTTPFDESTTVTITAEEGTTIYYTLDGTDPTTQSTQYTEPITLTATTTVKAIAVKGEVVSEVATATFISNAYQLVGQGTLENPFTASDAIWLANNGEYVDEECYIKGIVFKVNTTDANITSYGNIDYYISEDGQEKTPSFEVYRGMYFDGAKFTVDTKVLVGDEVVVKGKLTMYKTQAETAQGAVLVKLVRDGQEVTPVEVVNAPTISGEATFEETVTVTITADEGTTIYYTLDGTDPTIQSTLYTEAFTLSETTTVKAIAAKGETVSEVATATFTKTEPTPEDGIVFDFNADYTTLFGIDEVTSKENVYNFETSTNSATVEGVFVTVSAAEEGVSTPNRIWNSDPRLRLYSGYLMFTSQTNKIEKIVLTRSTNGSLVANQNTADSGVLTTSDQQNNAEVEWTGQATRVKITIAGNTQFSKAVVYLGDVPTGITNVTANANANVLYNMAGQRVAKGYKGLVIVEGKKMLVK